MTIIRTTLLTLLCLVLLMGGRQGKQAPAPHEPGVRHSGHRDGAAEIDKTVDCPSPAAFAARSGIRSIRAHARVGFESGFDERLNRPFEYAVALDLTSAQVVFGDGQSLALEDAEPGGSVDLSRPESHCRNYTFLSIGELAVIKLFLAPGNPYPAERHWAIHMKDRVMVDLGDFIKGHGHLEQISADCIRSVERGSAADPGTQDLWCASLENPQPRLVERLMTLDQERLLARAASSPSDVQRYHWFRCNRSSGSGLVSDATHASSIGQSEPVSDAAVIARMHDACGAWAKE